MIFVRLLGKGQDLEVGLRFADHKVNWMVGGEVEFGPAWTPDVS